VLELQAKIKELAPHADNEKSQLDDALAHAHKVASAEHHVRTRKTTTTANKTGSATALAEFVASAATKASAKSTIRAADIASACTQSFFEGIPPNFCWKKGADVGVIPTACPGGWHRVAALCFQNCASNEHFDGASLCIQNCPGNCTCFPLTCTHFDWLVWNDWTVNLHSYFAPSMTNFDGRIPCPSGMYRSGALCYRDCANIGLQNCGIGMCAGSSSACASGIANMITSFLVGLAQFVGFVLSFGTDAPAAEEVNAGKTGLKTLLNAAKNTLKDGFNTIKNIATNSATRAKFISKLQETAVNKLKAKIVNTVTSEAVSKICGTVGNSLLDKAKAQANPPSSFNIDSLDPLGIKSTVNDCGNITDTNSGIQCASDILNAVAAVDPTGLASMAGAFMQPVCDV